MEKNNLLLSTSSFFKYLTAYRNGRFHGRWESKLRDKKDRGGNACLIFRVSFFFHFNGEVIDYAKRFHCE